MRPHLARIKDHTKGIIQYLCKGTQISEAKLRLAVGGWLLAVGTPKAPMVPIALANSQSMADTLYIMSSSTSLWREIENPLVEIYDYLVRRRKILRTYDFILPKFHLLLPKFHFSPP